VRRRIDRVISMETEEILRVVHRLDRAVAAMHVHLDQQSTDREVERGHDHRPDRGPGAGTPGVDR
jgi:hypothetical protein